MIDKNNILLITEDSNCVEQINRKLVLLRSDDKISVIGYGDIKSVIPKSMFNVVLLHEISGIQEKTFKMIECIRALDSKIPIILLLNDVTPEFVLSAYDFGVDDFYLLSSPAHELLIKTLNCYKTILLKKKYEISNNILSKFGVYSEGNKFYKRSHFQRFFGEIASDPRIKKGFFVILTSNELQKEPSLIDKLSKSISNSLRFDDIVAYSNTGKFYLILPNINIEGVKFVIEKIQDSFGDDNKIYSGICEVGQLKFEVLEQNALNALSVSIQNDESCTYFKFENDNYPETENSSDKNFKFLQNIFNKKLERVVKPLFRHYRDEFESTFPDISILQYVNESECYFSLKSDIVSSELILKNIKCSKFVVDITHSGFGTPEKTKKVLSLSGITEENLSKLLLELKNDFVSSSEQIL